MVHRFSAGRTLVVWLLAVVATGCCARKPAAPPPEVLKPKPIDAWVKADSFCVLPLAEAQVPSTGGELAASIVAAWTKGLVFPNTSDVVQLQGGRYPAVEQMRVDLSDAVTVPKAKRPGVTTPATSAQSLWVSDFAIIAEPLRSKESQTEANFQVTARGVRFDLQQSKEGQPLLLMSRSRSGTLHFDVAVRDLEKSMLTSARERGGMVTVRDVRLDVKSYGPRSLDLKMHVSTLVGFVPAGMTFTARVDIDEQMNTTIYDLTAEGDEALGPILAYFIRPALAKYDGKTKPLMSFPNPEVRLKDVQITAGERITLDAVFGE